MAQCQLTAIIFSMWLLNVCDNYLMIIYIEIYAFHLLLYNTVDSNPRRTLKKII
jgi:hypothetical protein